MLPVYRQDVMKKAMAGQQPSAEDMKKLQEEGQKLKKEWNARLFEAAGKLLLVSLSSSVALFFLSGLLVSYSLPPLQFVFIICHHIFYLRLRREQGWCDR